MMFKIRGKLPRTARDPAHFHRCIKRASEMRRQPLETGQVVLRPLRAARRQREAKSSNGAIARQRFKIVCKEFTRPCGASTSA